MGFGDRFIGLTVLALGTSLPELAASVVAAVRDEAAFRVGNVVGSNVYNVLAVLGVVAPVSVPDSTVSFDFPALVGFTAVAVGFMARRRRVSRWNGLALLAGYAGFVWLLV